MALIANINIPENKRVVISLTYIHGIGKSLAQQILKQAEVDENIRVKNLTEAQLQKIRSIIALKDEQSNKNKYIIEGELRSFNTLNIKRLKDIKSYRGIRHRKKLPARGQVTQKNARTLKGKRSSSVGKKTTFNKKTVVKKGGKK